MTMHSSTRNIVAFASAELKKRSEDINKLNVFPVPDGDTGTNMSLTLEAVTSDVSKLQIDAELEDVCKAATHGSLMGARGNSGVITSQIIRGVCEGILESDGLPVTERLAISLESAARVAYQAVRKPVEGTILTVCKDLSIAARECADQGMSFEDALQAVSKAGHESVLRTPDLLPVLKESGVVDAGGFGLVILFDAIVASVLGVETSEISMPMSLDTLSVNPIDDWDDDEYLYCTEFLLFGDSIDREKLHDFIASQGGSELVVGDHGQYKIHVHTNDPSVVLAHSLSLGEIAEVHIHNMRKQQEERPDNDGSKNDGPAKPLGVVAVASGKGLVKILKSLGVDVVITGGQTMNPSTQDIVDAIDAVNADSVIVLPNNKNIVMAANAAASVSSKPVFVVPTRSVPQAFASMLMFDGSGEPEDIANEMQEGYEDVITIEITTAVKDAKGKVGDIEEGQTIAIIDGSDIESAGDSIDEVVVDVLTKIDAENFENLTLLAGEDLPDADLEKLVEKISQHWDNLEIETHRGEQPLYPLIMSIE